MHKCILCAGFGTTGWAGVFFWQIRYMGWKKVHSLHFATARDLDIYSAVSSLNEVKKERIRKKLYLRNPYKLAKKINRPGAEAVPDRLFCFPQLN